MRDVDDICVVIPAYGDTPHLPAILEALASGSRTPKRVIVSHSGPGDVQAGLEQAFPNVTFIHSDTRLFAGAARNRGTAQSTERILAFCDSDVLPAPDWLERLLHALTAVDRRFVVGSVGMARTGGYWGQTNWLCEFSELAPWRKEGEQAGGGSGNMAVFRAHFDEAGGFPEGVRTGQDTLLFHSLRRLGLQQWYVPSATVGHFNHAGLASMVRHQWMHGRAFVNLRREARLPGWRVVRSRWLALLLPAAKALKIVRRLLEGPARQWIMIALYAPGLLVGMASWGAGVLKEIGSVPVNSPTAPGHREPAGNPRRSD